MRQGWARCPVPHRAQRGGLICSLNSSSPAYKTSLDTSTGTSSGSAMIGLKKKKWGTLRPSNMWKTWLGW
uniref:Hypothetical 7.6K protein n=1 Tax=murine pneumonia virus TaxID=11263 RepID=Q7LZW1_9MONO